MVTPFIGSARATEATDQQLITSGAVGLGGYDPVDNDYGYRRLGTGSRDVPWWTLEKARAYSVAAYRTNPMARAILDTYSSFAVGSSGISLQAPDPDVRRVAEDFLNDKRTSILTLQELMFRSHLVNGESVYEMMSGTSTGVTRWSPIEPARIQKVELKGGNPLWPTALHISQTGADDAVLPIVEYDDLVGRRVGQAMWFASFKTTLTDVRGYPFLGPILDWLDSYDTILSNLVDRTALARYMVWDVSIEGDQNAIDEFIANRGGKHAPKSGTVEVHNKQVEWKPQAAQTGSFEDTNTTSAALTMVAAGAGLAKHWIAEPENANRATSMTMAEPVRRRVGGVQNIWLGIITEMTRYAVDQAVAAGQIDAMVTISDTDGEREVPAADTVKLTGPEIAATDPQISATVLLNLSQSFSTLISGGLMSVEAARFATKKAWEDFCGVPYAPQFDKPEVEVDDLADLIADTQPVPAASKLTLLGPGTTAAQPAPSTVGAPA